MYVYENCFLEKSVQYVNRVNKVYLHPSLCHYVSKVGLNFLFFYFDQTWNMYMFHVKHSKWSSNNPLNQETDLEYG